jgi:predicted nuclease of predicted toxin-antitoxin system
MKYIVDECTGPRVANWLLSLGFDVFSVPMQGRGMADLQILEKANLENRIIITNDKDFGELIFKDNHQHKGVIFMRIEDETSQNKILVLSNLFTNHLQLIDNEAFIVVTDNSIRVAKKK